MAQPPLRPQDAVMLIPSLEPDDRLPAYVRRLLDKGFQHVVIVDDGSSAAYQLIFAELDAMDGVSVTHHELNRGKGCAVRTAFLEAGGDLVMFTDADLAYGTDVIKRVYETHLAHPEAGMVIGSRNLDGAGYAGYTFFRRVASKVYIRLLCVIGGFRLSDSQCGCKGYTQDAVKKIFPRCLVDGFAFDFETILWAGKLGIGIVEMPVSVQRHSSSKVHVMRDAFKMLADLHRMKKRIASEKV